MEFYYKVHRSGTEVLVAACDKEILGKTISHKGADVKINSSFYGEKLCRRDEILAAIRTASIVNLMGNKVVDAVIKEGLVKEENILLVGDVKHAQIIVL